MEWEIKWYKFLLEHLPFSGAWIHVLFVEIYERSAWTNLPAVAMKQVPPKPQVNIYQTKRRQIPEDYFAK
jgi:hypothetical protein